MFSNNKYDMLHIRSLANGRVGQRRAFRPSNIEFTCRPESVDQAAVRRTHFSSTDRTQADNCNDLLGGYPSQSMQFGISDEWSSEHFAVDAVTGPL